MMTRDFIEERWAAAIISRDQYAATKCLQYYAWQTLSLYLNGSLGRGGVLFPLILSESRSIKMLAKKLTYKWHEYLSAFPGQKSSRKVPVDGSVAQILIFHYKKILQFLPEQDEHGKKHNCNKIKVKEPKSNELRRLAKTISTCGTLIHSYWLHGSVGSDDEKPYWSDCDGIAIISTEAFLHEARLKKLRYNLIRTRVYMTDYFPYQMHGHFIVSEIDLRSFPSEFFPPILFKDAACLYSQHKSLQIWEVFNQDFAKQLLFEHGLNYLSKNNINKNSNTSEKILFLHRVYLLPCLISQCFANPLFKREAFKNLDEIVGSENVALYNEASKVWDCWVVPPYFSRVTFSILWPFRFNPILYQKFHLMLGKNIRWITGPEIDWDKVSTQIKVHAMEVSNNLIEAGANRTESQEIE